MNTVLTITLSVLIFGFLILSHEFGHYLAARKCGVIVDEFSIGMGPLLAQKKKKGTFWSLRLLPLGGYCKMKGEDENDLSEGTFNAAKPIKRIIILLSGALMNLLTAVLLFFAIYAIQGTDATTTLAKVSEGSPAMSAGIRPGDEITAINGTPIESWEDITDIIRGGTGQPLEIELIRENGQSETVTLTPLYDEQEKAYLIGITPVIKTNVIKAFGLSFYMVGYYIAALCNIFGDLFKGLVGLEIFSGPIGATAIIGQYINQGATVILTIAASIAVSLGFFNLLPLPALDGSRILFVLYEMIFKKPINRRVEAVIHTVGLMAMMLFGLFIAYRDIINLR